MSLCQSIKGVNWLKNGKERNLLVVRFLNSIKVHIVLGEGNSSNLDEVCGTL